MNGTNVRSEAENKLSSPRKREEARIAAWEPSTQWEGQLHVWNRWDAQQPEMSQTEFLFLWPIRFLQWAFHCLEDISNQTKYKANLNEIELSEK